MANYLAQYLNLAIENAPPASSSSNSSSHYMMIANVAIEYCVVTKRLDLLFGDIFSAFVDAGHGHTFVDLLEPFVLNDQLTYISPLVMSSFVEFCKLSDDLSRVERCLVHLDVSVMDFDAVLKLLRENKMYCALLHVYTSGLNDFVAPLQMLFEEVFDTAEAASDVGKFNDARDASVIGAPWRLATGSFEFYGGLAMLFIDRCFKGKMFPRGGDIGYEDGGAEVVGSVLGLLMQGCYLVSKNPKNRRLPQKSRGLKYCYLRILLILDVQSLLGSFSVLFTEGHGGGMWDLEGDRGVMTTSDIVGTLYEVIVVNKENGWACGNEGQGDNGRGLMGCIPQSSVDRFLDFVADLLKKQIVIVDRSLTCMVLKRLVERGGEELVSVLEALQRDSFDRNEAMGIVQVISCSS